MRAAKRQWIYTGLAVPRGVAVVRRTPPRAQRGPHGSIVLVGDESAHALATPLNDLAGDAHTTFVARYAPQSTASNWASDAVLDSQLQNLRPAHVLYAMDGQDARAVIALVAKARLAGAKALWLSLPGRPAAPFVDTMRPPLWVVRPGLPMTVGTYAAWAGAIWRQLG
jgi:hypothetical protein